jgi:hypothetical protein
MADRQDGDDVERVFEKGCPIPGTVSGGAGRRRRGEEPGGDTYPYTGRMYEESVLVSSHHVQAFSRCPSSSRRARGRSGERSVGGMVTDSWPRYFGDSIGAGSMMVGFGLGTGVASPLPYGLEGGVSASVIEASVACEDTEKLLCLLSAA